MTNKVLVGLLLFSIGLSAQNMAEKDKQKHFVAGTISGAGGYAIGYKITKKKGWAMVSSVVASSLAGLAKESFDKSQGRDWSGADLKATMFGGITVGTTFNIAQKRKRKKKRCDCNY